MQGLIQSAQGGDQLTPEKVKQGIQIPAEYQQAYQRVVAAGMQMMFSKESNQAAVDVLMRGQGSDAQKLGQAIAGLLGLIVKETNGTIPPQVIIPAGVELLIQAADFLRRTNLVDITNQVIGDAMDVMVTSVMKAAGLDVQKVAGFIEQKAGGAQPQPMGV